MIEKCPECEAVVGKDILSLPHICKLSDKLRKSLKYREQFFVNDNEKNY